MPLRSLSGRGRGRTGAGRRFAVVFAAFALAVACALSAPTAADDGPSGLTARAPGECRGCHVDACERWERSAHALTTRPAARGVVPVDVAAEREVVHPPGRSRFRDAGGTFVIETAADDGAVRPFPLEIVVGVRRMQMLVVRMDDGRLQVAPAMRESAGPWFDYTHLLFGATELGPPPVVLPGEPSYWTGPDRSFDVRCARCHTSAREPVEPRDGRGPRSRIRSLGIDCVSCHRDPAPHLAHWSVPGAVKKDDPIPSLAGLARSDALAVCLPCHLEGEVLDPRGAAESPGDPLVWIEPTGLDDLVRADAAGRPTELMYEGLSLLTATCAEKGGLTCLTCHEVHGSPSPFALRVAPDQDVLLCRSCHEAIAAEPGAHSHHRAGGTGARCTTCHMPAVPVERGHGAVRDHTIGLPVPAGAGESPGRDACTWCHTGARNAPPGAPRLDAARLDAAWREWWPGARTGPWWSRLIDRARRGDADVASDLAALARDGGAPRLVRMSAARLLVGFPDASERTLLALAADRDPLLRRAALRGLASVRTDAADAALLAAAGDPSAPVRFVAARSALAGWDRVRASKALREAVLPVLAEDAAAVPEDHLRWFRLGAARQIAGDVAGAIAAYERKLALDPGAKAVRETIARLRATLPK